MKNITNPFTKIASVIFGIIAFLHLLRLTLFHLEIVAGNFHLPLWISLVGCVIAATLCIGLWKEANKRL
jgi:hypothetical protein